MTGAQIYARWCAMDDQRDRPQTRRWARLLCSALVDGEDIAQLPCPYFIAGDLVDFTRAQVQLRADEIAAIERCVAAGRHRFWMDGHDELLCLSCHTYATPAERDAWIGSERGQRWQAERIAELDETHRREHRRQRIADVREGLGNLTMGAAVLGAWVIPIVALVAYLI